MKHAFKKLLLTVCMSILLFSCFIISTNTASASSGNTVTIKESNHKIAYFNPTYPTCYINRWWQNGCYFTFVNKLNKNVVVTFSFGTVVLKPNKSVTEFFAYNSSVEYTRYDRKPTPTSVVSIWDSHTYASCYIFVYSY